MIDLAWRNPVLVDSEAEEKWRREALKGCSPWSLADFLSPRMRKMLRLSRAQAWRWFNLRRNDSVFGRVSFKRGTGVWIDVRERASLLDERVEETETRAEEASMSAVPPPACLIL
jgi:hypothetical protein